jgi:hypothetical protein
MITAVSTTFDWYAEIEMATSIDIRNVKIRKMGNACFLKKSGQQPIVRETAIRLTDRIITAAGLMKMVLNTGLL